MSPETISRLAVGLSCGLFLGSVALITRDFYLLAIAIVPMVVMEIAIHHSR